MLNLRVDMLILLLLLLPVAGHAQELDIGHLETPDDTGINWLNFHCNQNGNKLACDVFQTLIMHKVEPAEREKEIAKKMAGDVQNEFKAAFGKTCENIDQILPVITKATETGVGADGRKLNPRQAQEGKAFFDSLAEACRNTTVATIRHFAEMGVDKDIHTCRVVDSYSHMDFSYDTLAQQWISKEGPSGPCGSVNVAKRITPRTFGYIPRGSCTRTRTGPCRAVCLARNFQIIRCTIRGEPQITSSSVCTSKIQCEPAFRAR